MTFQSACNNAIMIFKLFLNGCILVQIFLTFFMTKRNVLCLISLFFLSRKRVKSEMLSLFLRNEKWILFSFHSFREWKVKWKCIEIEIENEKWNENASRSRSRSEITKKISRILEKWDSRRLLLHSCFIPMLLLYCNLILKSTFLHRF